MRNFFENFLACLIALGVFCLYFLPTILIVYIVAHFVLKYW